MSDLTTDPPDPSLPLPSFLCELCNGLTLENVKFAGTMRRLPPGPRSGGFRRVFNNDAGYQHHRSLQALADSALHGCSFCTILYFGFCKYVAKWHGGKTNVTKPDSQFRIVSVYSRDSEQVQGLLLAYGNRIPVEFGLYLRAGDYGHECLTLAECFANVSKMHSNP